MIKLNTSRILVPFDFSITSKRAIRHAALLAQMSKGELLLYYVKRQKSFLNIGYNTSELRAIAGERQNYRKLIEDTAHDIRTEFKIPVNVSVGTGARISTISKTINKKRIGLIVMGTEGSESASSVFRGSNSHRVVSRSEIPVLTVRTDSKKIDYSNILLPVDLSEHTRQKVVVAIQVAKSFGGKIHLLGILNKSDKELAFKLDKILKQIGARLQSEDIEFTSETIETDIPVERTILAAKRKKADMIITMTDENAGSSILASKSFDATLIDESTVPVLSIPPEIHEENIEPASIGGLW
jgi:nucleotide-binding universal stress UspA family protein